METRRNNNLVNFLPIMTLIIVIILGQLTNRTGIEILKTGVLSLLLTGAVVFYLSLHRKEILCKPKAQLFITICYLISICFVMIPYNSGIINFWMLGGLLVSMIIDNKLGLLLNFNLAFLFGISLSLRPEIVIYLLIMGIILSLLSSYLKKKSTVVYASVIVLSSNITLAFVINNFIFDAQSSYDYMSSFFSIFIVLVIAYYVSMLYEKYMLKNDLSISMKEFFDKNDIRYKDSGILDENLSASNETIHMMELYNLETGTSYELLNEITNELLLRIKEYSESLYEHSIQIGNLSYRAAQIIGADEMLSKAGGYYHEVGKMIGKNYIEEGLILASEYGFPKELKAILRQHNIKYEKPTSIEAAIVMLSDNVVSTIEYIDKTGDKKFTTNKIIENIFQTRMEKGTFDETGLSVKDFKVLKEFYQNELKRKEI